MKRVIVFLIILAIANFASAGIVDVVISSLNGETLPVPVNEIAISPTDVVGLDVVYTADTQDWFVWSISMEMVQSVPGSGTFDISELTWAIDGYWNFDLAGGIPMTQVTMLPNGNPLIDALAKDFGTVPPGIVIDHFLFHCDGIGDVAIQLVENPNTRAMESLESDWNDLYTLLAGPGVIIYQIPEPMTLTLLGLGGLFLVRRKK